MLTWATVSPARFFRIITLCILLFPVTYLLFYNRNRLSEFVLPHLPAFTDDDLLPPHPDNFTSTFTFTPTTYFEHPIDQLVSDAEREYIEFRKNEAHTLAEAARKYREKRGRHPPPGFDVWFKTAQEKGALNIEPLYDQIYHDLEPFWGAEPKDLRDFAKRWPSVVTIRNHKPFARTDTDTAALWNFWLFAWRDIIKTMPNNTIPDVDLPMVQGDEPHVMLTFKRITEHMERAKQRRIEHNELPIDRMNSTYPSYPKMEGSSTMADVKPTEHLTTIAPRTYWDFVLDACKPDDPVFAEPHQSYRNYFHPTYSTDFTTGSMDGYVSNYTKSKNPCHNPNLRSLHGHLIAPNIDAIYTELYPIFGVAKLAGASNDIMVPHPDNFVEFGIYLAGNTTYSWHTKKNKAVWRGTATGGQHDENNWIGFHRHRLIATMNSTTVSNVEREMEDLPEPSYPYLAAKDSDFDWGLHNIVYPSARLFTLAAQTYHKLGAWAARIFDTGFTHYYCNPERLYGDGTVCEYTEPYYAIAEKMNNTQILHHKYLPDVDGQSSSGRFRGFMQSLSVPIKATIFLEWRESRLIPWKHFVPMSNEFQEWWGLMQYFIGYKADGEGEESVEGHDKVGERIGREGSEWTHRVERKDDMMLYFYRLILEYARICADNRVELGYVEDLRGGGV